MILTLDTWLTLASIALPLIVKVASDVSVNAAAKHNLALARITDMAARQAGSIARALQAVPSGSDAKTAEQALIAAAVNGITDEMSQSSAVVGATTDKIKRLVQNELDKLLATKAAQSLGFHIVPSTSA